VTQDFLPTLPAMWQRVPFKHACALNPEVLPESTREDEEIQYVDISALEDGVAELAPKTMTFGEAPSRARRLLREGDTIISTVRTYLRAVATFSPFEGKLVASTGFAVLRSNGRLLPRYAYWATLSDPVIESVVAHSDGVSYPAISPTVLGTLTVPVPPEAEQERIANFLEEKTARIDALILEKEALRSKASELFTSRLGTAVVEGASRDMQLVSAERQGFVLVRADWPLIPLKYLVTTGGGLTPSKDNEAYWDGSVPWISPKDMKQFVLWDSIDHISELALAETALSLHPVNSVLVVVRGMILAHTFPVALNAVPVTVNQDMKALRASGRISPQYLAWLLRGLQPLMLSLTEESAHGTKALRTEKWSNQAVPVPSPDEQARLVALFDRWSQDTQLLVENLSQHIDRLREYRASLISAAVTGQLDLNTFKSAA